ncbi:MAG: hypothetical protein ACRDJW_16970 [Thermomicrobiales bacterium]
MAEEIGAFVFPQRVDRQLSDNWRGIVESDAKGTPKRNLDAVFGKLRHMPDRGHSCFEGNR